MKPNPMLMPALWGGLTMGVLSALPIVSMGNCCCLWVVGGGLVAAYILQANAPDGMVITPSDGALVGLLAGVFGAVISAVLSLPLNLLMGPVQRRMLQRIIESTRDVPNEMRDLIANMSGTTATAVQVLAGLMFMLVVGAVFSTLGGLLGAVLFKRKVPPPPPAE